MIGLLLWLAVGGARAAFAADTSDVDLSGSWREVQPGDTPALVLEQARQGRLTRFDPANMQVFPRQHLGSWVVLAQLPPWVAQDRVLALRSPGYGTVSLFGPDGSTQTTALNDFDASIHGHGRLAFTVPADWSATAPLVLRFNPSPMIAAPVSFQLSTVDAYEHRDTLWLTMAAFCFGVMLAMAGMAICFAAMLRDATFGWYAGYIASYAVLQSLQRGVVFHPLQLTMLASSVVPLGTAVTALSVTCAALFVLRFCEIERNAPLLRAPLLTVAIAVSVMTLLRATGIDALSDLAQTMLNPLMMLSASLMLVASLYCALHGVRAAGYFLAGWTPLLVLTVLSSAQVSGALADIVWLDDACIVAGAIEAVVLSAGLADRALTMRHDRERDRELANSDSLTGVLNRRAWIEAAQARLAGSMDRPQTLLFLDLDHFKMLNDCQGHAAGDRALIAVAEVLGNELRPDDLLGRFGGEEFVALLDGLEPSDANQVSTRLCRRVHRLEIPIDMDGGLLTASIGTAHRRVDDTITSLVERADAAMYEAKANGRNQVVSDDQLPRMRPAPPRLHLVSRKEEELPHYGGVRRTAGDGDPSGRPPGTT